MRDFEKYLEKLQQEENDHFTSPSPKKWFLLIYLIVFTTLKLEITYISDISQL